MRAWSQTLSQERYCYSDIKVYSNILLHSNIRCKTLQELLDLWVQIWSLNTTVQRCLKSGWKLIWLKNPAVPPLAIQLLQQLHKCNKWRGKEKSVHLSIGQAKREWNWQEGPRSTSHGNSSFSPQSCFASITWSVITVKQPVPVYS